jgi:hypothetical protein
LEETTDIGKLSRRHRRIHQTLDQLVDHLLVEHENITGERLDDGHFDGPRSRPDDLITFSNIVMEKFWLGLDISKIPDPHDTNPSRAALKAAVVEQMVEVQHNVWKRLTTLYGAPARHRGYAPEWCEMVEPSPVRIWLIPQESRASKNKIFLRKNIMTMLLFMNYC